MNNIQLGDKIKHNKLFACSNFTFSNFRVQISNCQISFLQVLVISNILICKFHIFNLSISILSNSRISKSLVQRHSKQIKILDPQIDKHNSFQKCLHILLYFLKYFGRVKWINTGFQRVKNPEIMEMLGLSLSNNKTKILLDQNWSN